MPLRHYSVDSPTGDLVAVSRTVDNSQRVSLSSVQYRAFSSPWTRVSDLPPSINASSLICKYLTTHTHTLTASIDIRIRVREKPGIELKSQLEVTLHLSFDLSVNEVL